MNDRLAKQRQKQAAKGAHAQVQPAKAAPPPTRKFPLPRLPNGSVAHGTYADESWSGSLLIPHEGGFKEFKATARAQFTLFQKLDGMYRDWRKKQEAKTL